LSIGKPSSQQNEFKIPVIQDCHLRSVGVREHRVGSLIEENGVLEAVIENGLLDLVEYNLVNLLPLNKVPKLGQEQYAF
jgi:hypothetical protein